MTRRLVGAGLLGTLVATVCTTVGAALGRAAGVDLEVPDGGEVIPVSGIAFVTAVLSVVGVLIAVALLRWSGRPADRFLWIAGALTALSLVPPLVSGADVATAVTLVALHLLAAAVVIPVLVRGLRGAARP
ncbi:hypothetical protein ASC77_05365 [Nocardioides sp. Root1257]|uniref:DUF6069 family protein n=1 Tax=unclassified Nocardioides TaxID=2615069 RepID=UPI0006FAA313|nr:MULTISPECIES: DUF6069 family protein [unclassified Nocardioides]KQW53696.1 hypothetical protein ASC77_05365 [Nocardioides sp. Root1257]KRC56382.1 hypothetical protein ASE24_05365 [Nocardioides sp. Root224]